MYKYLILASLCAAGYCRPTLVESGGDYGGYGGGFGLGDSGGGWQGALSLGSGGGGLGHDFEGASSSYGTIEGHGGGDGGGSGGSIGGDFHHGVSIVSTGGGEHKGKVFDLTDHGGQAHQGSFGGSFVASSKYSAGGQDGGGGGHGGYGVSEGGGFAEHYSDVLGASDQGSSGGGGHGGWESLSSGSFGGGGEGLSSYSSSGALGGGYH
ncbi:hypothetical protein JTB14_009154 [Gonioctena quinquepunctata]|nr:hypothetical protein JTB14_009154 [Gonioctena quinquepunctata]